MSHGVGEIIHLHNCPDSKYKNKIFIFFFLAVKPKIANLISTLQNWGGGRGWGPKIESKSSTKNCKPYQCTFADTSTAQDHKLVFPHSVWLKPLCAPCKKYLKKTRRSGLLVLLVLGLLSSKGEYEQFLNYCAWT